MDFLHFAKDCERLGYTLYYFFQNARLDFLKCVFSREGRYCTAVSSATEQRNTHNIYQTHKTLVRVQAFVDVAHDTYYAVLPRSVRTPHPLGSRNIELLTRNRQQRSPAAAQNRKQRCRVFSFLMTQIILLDRPLTRLTNATVWRPPPFSLPRHGHLGDGLCI